jgi:hypothetical protein
MKTADAIRWENLIDLIREAGGDEALAEKYGCTVAYVRQMKLKSKDSDTGKEKGIGNATARKLELCMGKPRGWLDQDHSASSEANYVARQYESGGDDKRTAMKDIAELPDEVSAALRPIIEAMKAKYEKK